MNVILRMVTTEGNVIPTKPFPSELLQSSGSPVVQLIAQGLLATNNAQKMELVVADTGVPIKTIEVTQIDHHLFPQMFE